MRASEYFVGDLTLPACIKVARGSYGRDSQPNCARVLEYRSTNGIDSRDRLTHHTRHATLAHIGEQRFHRGALHALRTKPCGHTVAVFLFNHPFNLFRWQIGSEYSTSRRRLYRHHRTGTHVHMDGIARFTDVDDGRALITEDREADSLVNLGRQ